MHGKGIVFSDCISKSASFAYPQYSNNEAIILLCEVALGNANNTFSPDICGDPFSKGCNCTIGVGLYQPISVETYESTNNKYNVKVPVGPFKESLDFNGFLKYNEMIMYFIYYIYYWYSFNPNQVRFKYLLKVKIENKKKD